MQTSERERESYVMTNHCSLGDRKIPNFWSFPFILCYQECVVICVEVVSWLKINIGKTVLSPVG